MPVKASKKRTSQSDASGREVDKGEGDAPPPIAPAKRESQVQAHDMSPNEGARHGDTPASSTSSGSSDVSNPIQESTGTATLAEEMYMPRDSDGRFVIAMPAIIEQVKAMDSPTAAERLVIGVPFQENIPAKQSLEKHFLKQPRSGTRYNLVCNTGPKGVGKTTLQCQNMLQMAKLGCLSVFIDFNGLQPSEEHEKGVPFEARVALRVQYYCHGGRYSFQDYMCWAIEGGMDDVRRMTIVDAVEELKHAVGHGGPVFLAIDELKKSSTDKESLTSNLTRLCFVMDNALRKGKQPERDFRIFLAVSVYDIVSLAGMATDSSRNLLYQPTPPIFPVWVERDHIAKDAVAKLPNAVRIFFNENARTDIRLGFHQERAKKRLSQLGQLLFDTGGHGRRVERLVEYCRDLPPMISDVLEMGDEEFNKWHADVTDDMDDKLNFCTDVVDRLINRAVDLEHPSSFLKDVLEGLFSSTDVYNDTQPKGQSVRLATADHYGLLGSKVLIGYLPMPAVSLLCKRIQAGVKKCAEFRTTTLFSSTKAMVAEVELSVRKPEAGRHTVQQDDAKSFERCMMHTMCAALISGQTLEKMLRRGTPRGVLLRSLSKIVVLDEVKAFPCVFEDRSSRVTGIADSVMDAVLKVGIDDEDKAPGLAFHPTEKYNLCCDFVLVLPKVGGGRLVLLVQCKHWFTHTIKDRYAFDEFRYGRQYVERDTVPTAKMGSHTMVQNPAARQFRQLKENNTTVHFVLLTVNKAPHKTTESTEMANTLSSGMWNVPHADHVGDLRDDESVMDLEHMREWCPTVAYSALMALKVREVWSKAQE